MEEIYASFLPLFHLIEMKIDVDWRYGRWAANLHTRHSFDNDFQSNLHPKLFQKINESRYLNLLFLSVNRNIQTQQ